MDSVQDLDILMGHLGDFGKYQLFQFILHVLSGVTAGMHMLSLITVGAVPDHRCFVPELDGNSTSLNFSHPNLTQFVPMTPLGVPDSCNLLGGFNQTISCDRWVYDTTYYKSSRGMEWNFVCDRRWMGAVAQSSYMFGVFFGAITLGSAADKYGRKTIYCWSATFQLILGVLVAFVPEFYSFLVIRFLYGIFGSAGSYITGFVLTMELVGPSKRTPCGIAFQAAFAVGFMLVAGWGAIVKDRQILQIIYGLHSLILFANWWIMDESPRWLWAQGRVKESVAIIQKGLKMNSSPITIDPNDYVSKTKIRRDSTQNEEAGLGDLFKTPNLRNKTLNVCLCWFANSIAYYGLSLSAGKLYGNPYLILFLMGIVEIPSYLLTALIMDRTGRRGLISFYMLTGGLCCLIAAKLTQGSTEATSTVMIGKFLIASSFAIVYNYSAELFPTVVRNSALGLGSMCARLSGAMTPLISLLDSLNPTLPAMIFGVIALISGFLTLFLPETLGYPMPQSIEDGEKFGAGDTCFTACMGKKRRLPPTPPKEEGIIKEMQPLDRKNQDSYNHKEDEL
ncbi:solute carrier family 22 member [Holotrichia oblita]|uniref:Solute carrier family 22 member n=2 Tax=Holotrichia oblita TaxID=644536 RepID=A0ACB9SSV3_HOLOL|nr:solute carrier family 22 member [Holotrichia oblita]KAI4457569.1 solute carrier family 22 member [Holotrichia oblita]